ncbi:UNVERIFIED_CONTAM: hypothetical protein FKN15_030985 [Acipenser sinensis]
MNTRCPPKRVPSAARFFTHCELTGQLPQSYSTGGQRSSGQLTGKPAGARPDYRGRWCAPAEGAVVSGLNTDNGNRTTVIAIPLAVFFSRAYLFCSRLLPQQASLGNPYLGQPNAQYLWAEQSPKACLSATKREGNPTHPLPHLSVSSPCLIGGPYEVSALFLQNHACARQSAQISPVTGTV